MTSNLLQTLAGTGGVNGSFGSVGGSGSGGQFGTSFSLDAQGASDIAGGAVNLGSAFLAKGVAKEAKETTRLASQINQQRVARRARYEVSQAEAGNAALGNTQHGSFLFVNAQNAREAQERVEDERLRGVNREIQIERNRPDIATAGVGFAAGIAGAFAKSFSGGV